MEKLIKGFVSVLGLGIILGTAMTYALLINYLTKSNEMSDVFTQNIFEDIKSMDAFEINNLKYGIFSSNAIQKNTVKNLKNHGLLCSLGTYKYGGIEVYNGTAIIAEIEEDLVLKPLLLKSSLNATLTTHPQTKGVVIAHPGIIEISCSYEKVFEKTYNSRITITALNIKEKTCEISSSKPFIANQYSLPINERFIQINLASLEARIPILDLIAYLDTTQIEELKKLLDPLQSKLDVVEKELRINNIASLDLDIKDIVFLRDDAIKDLKKELENINVLDDVPSTEKVDKSIQKYEREINKFFDAEIINIYSQYMSSKNNVLNTLYKLQNEEKRVIKELTSVYSFQQLGSMSSEELTNEINRIAQENVNVKDIREAINTMANANVNVEEINKLLELDTSIIDRETYEALIKVYNRTYTIKDLKDDLNRCMNLAKYKKLETLMDLTELSFSPSYTAETSYKRMETFELLNNKIESKANALKSFSNTLEQKLSLTPEEKKKLESVLLKGNITSIKDIKDLKKIFEKYSNTEYVKILDKVLSLDDIALNDIISTLPDARASISIGGVVPSYCDAASTANTLISIDIALQGYNILTNNFDINRLTTIKFYGKDIKSYEALIKDLKSLGDFDITDIKRCVNVLDIRNLALLLLSYQQKDVNPDYITTCYYKDFSSLGYEALIHNSTSNIATLIFKPQVAKTFTSYEVKYNPYYVIDTSESFNIYNEALNKLKENKNTLLEIRNKIKESIDSLEEKEFEFVSIECGKCNFAPNPLKRITSDKVKSEVESILQAYRDKINISVVEVEVKEQVEDKSQQIDAGCLCSTEKGNKVMKICKTKYVVNRNSNIYLLYNHKGYKFIIKIVV